MYTNLIFIDFIMYEWSLTRLCFNHHSRYFVSHVKFLRFFPEPPNPILEKLLVCSDCMRKNIEFNDNAKKLRYHVRFGCDSDRNYRFERRSRYFWYSCCPVAIIFRLSLSFLWRRYVIRCWYYLWIFPFHFRFYNMVYKRNTVFQSLDFWFDCETILTKFKEKNLYMLRTTFF